MSVVMLSPCIPHWSGDRGSRRRWGGRGRGRRRRGGPGPGRPPVRENGEEVIDVRKKMCYFHPSVDLTIDIKGIAVDL